MHLAKDSCERESKDAWGASERDIWGAVMANGAHVQDVPVRCCVAGWGGVGAGRGRPAVVLGTVEPWRSLAA